MPEGPEIHRAAATLHKRLAGAVPTEVHFGLKRLERFSDTLCGQRIQQVCARGKGIVITFENAYAIFSHNQLYGQWRVLKEQTALNTRRQVRIDIRVPKWRAVLLSASTIEVVPTEALPEISYLARLGPDLLAPDTTARLIADRAALPAFRGRRLGGLLLDQGFVAGMGNYLRSEALFVAGLDPALRPRDLDRAACIRLGRAMLRCGQRARDNKGVTQAPADYTRARNGGEAHRTARHYAFARRQQPCRRCTATIERITVAARRLYWCPECQAR